VVHAGAGHWCRIFLGQTPGWASGEPGVTAEDLADHLADAFDPAGAAIPADTNESTDLIHERATGRAEAMTRAQIAPTEVESRF
jgi:hypothetical protein